MSELSRIQSRKHLKDSIRQTLGTIYSEQQADSVFEPLMALVDAFPRHPASEGLQLSERDSMLITYGDQVKRPGEAPLDTLKQVLQQLQLPVSSVHILPFYPYSSDDGFSVIDYYEVDPALGTWDEVRELGRHYRLMFDAVFNHISAKSSWFQGFLGGQQPYTDYFVVADPAQDLSLVTRPRALPLLTPFQTERGLLNVWTTFSDDQIDLNAANPDVLVELVKVLLFYVQQGAQFIRLDAIAFLWKQIGTTCIHLPQTHQIIQLMRAVLDLAAPQTILITETNVPHQENISYFGDGTNEAQMVYQFPLPPLILHTMHTGSAAHLTRWAQGIQRVSDRTSFFNFTASHDGIGVRPVTGILSDDEIAALVQLTLDHGGHVSYKSNSDGSHSPYELNITYFDAITPPQVTATQPEVAVARFMVSQAIMLAFIGVPGIYFHSLFGSRNYEAGVKETGRYRTINREKLDADTLVDELEQPDSLRSRVFTEYTKLLQIRSNEPAFHPLGHQTVLDIHPQVFGLERASPDRKDRVIALHNVSNEKAAIAVRVNAEAGGWVDLVSGKTYSQTDAALSVELEPYQVAWLKAK